MSEAEILSLQRQTGMDRLQAIYHLRARQELQRRFRERKTYGLTAPSPNLAIAD